MKSLNLLLIPSLLITSLGFAHANDVNDYINLRVKKMVGLINSAYHKEKSDTEITQYYSSSDHFKKIAVAGTYARKFDKMRADKALEKAFERLKFVARHTIDAGRTATSSLGFIVADSKRISTREKGIEALYEIIQMENESSIDAVESLNYLWRLGYKSGMGLYHRHRVRITEILIQAAQSSNTKLANSATLILIPLEREYIYPNYDDIPDDVRTRYKKLKSKN